jgi:hypothetical protein
MSGSLTLKTIYGAELAPIDQVLRLLEAEVDPQRVSEFSKAVEAAKRLDHQNTERRNYWGELAIWSKRRLGVLIEEGQNGGWIRSEGRPGKCSHDANISADEVADKDTRSRAKALASVDEDQLCARRLRSSRKMTRSASPPSYGLSTSPTWLTTAASPSGTRRPRSSRRPAR